MERETAGSLAIKAALDCTQYNTEELGHETINDVAKQLEICAGEHSKIFDDDIEEFFLCYVIAKDPLIENVMRVKYYALPWLPKPRPDQGCFLYNRPLDKYTHLWSLPNALTMSQLSTFDLVHTKFRRMKFWCDAFFKGIFWEAIRKENNINHLAEEEIVDRNTRALGKRPRQKKSRKAVIEDIEKYLKKEDTTNV